MAERFYTARALFRAVSPLALPRLVGKLAGAYAIAEEAKNHQQRLMSPQKTRRQALAETLTAMGAGATITAASTDLDATERILAGLAKTAEHTAEAAAPVLIAAEMVRKMRDTSAGE